MYKKTIKRLLEYTTVLIVLISSMGAFAQEMSLEEIKNSLTISVLTPQSITAVTENFILPVTYNGAFIVWESDNENAICIDGGSQELWARVIRPPFGEGFVSATLTAYITKGDEMTQKSFLIRVKEKDIGFTYSQTMLETYEQFEMEFLSRQKILALKEDLYIPNTKLYDNVEISCKSSLPSVLSDEGKVTRSFDADTVVTFTVYFTQRFETFKVSYPITVKAYTDEEIRETVKKDLEEAVLKIKTENNLMSLTSNVELKGGDARKSTLSWSSSDSSVITSDGVINQSAAGKEAVLTVTASFQGATVSETLNIKIAASVGSINEVTGNIGIGSSGGGGGGMSQGNSKEDNEVVNKEESVAFTDVSLSHWAYDAISALYKNGTVNGIGGNAFAPDDKVTREQAVKIIMLALSFDIDESVQTSVFNDVKVGAWYVPYIEAAQNQGIVNGISDFDFGTGRSITRQELATMIYRATQKAQLTLSGDAQTDFADNLDIAPWASESVAELSAAGIINGRDGCFYPNDNATRAELCAMVYRLLD